MLYTYVVYRLLNKQIKEADLSRQCLEMMTRSEIRLHGTIPLHLLRA